MSDQGERGGPSGLRAQDERLREQERTARIRRRSARAGLAAGARTLFIIVGSLFNVVALLLVLGNTLNLIRSWTIGGPLTLDASQLVPLGAFLIGVICYAIAYQLDS